MRLIDWFAHNPVAANLVMVLILVGGLLTAFFITHEVFPEVSLDMITVSVEYLGAAPEEVADAVCVRIEEEVEGIEGIKRITSNASEGLALVIIELELGEDVRGVLDDVKARIDAIDTFPEEIEKPVVSEVTSRRQVINVSVWGEAGEAALKQVAERVRDEISAIDGITLVERATGRPYEISIEVSEDALRRHAITFDSVAGAVRRSSLDLPGGAIKTDGGEILLRTKGQAYRGHEFEDLVLLTRPDGTRLKLGDVARVVDGFADTDQETRFEGKPGVLLKVFRTGDQGALDIASKVNGYIEHAEADLPEGIHLTAWQDSAKILRDRLDLLLRNGRNGFVLVFLILAVFLRLRLAFWVGLGIPISFLGALWLMPGLDVTVNLISLFAFIVVLGIVVDDAIIVGENIFRRQQKSGRGVKAAIDGARQVAVPVFFAVLTSVAAFLPLLGIEGVTGKLMRVIPLIVIPCLLFSLVESLLILPAHLSHGAGPKAERKPGPWRRFQGLIAGGLDRFVNRVYSPLLTHALRWRHLTVAVGLATLILTVGTVAGGWIQFFFFPDVEADYVSAAVTLPEGTPAEITAAAVRDLERTAEQLRREIIDQTGQDAFRLISSSVGEQPYVQEQARNTTGMATMAIAAGHLGEVTIELAPAEERSVSSTAMANRWRELSRSIPDARELSFSSSIFSTGEDVNVQLTGEDLDQLRAAAAEIKTRLADYAGVHDIADSFREGKRELKLSIKPSAELLGLTLADLARQVRQAFYGEEAQRVQRGRDDIRVMVRYPEAGRRSLGDLDEMRIRTPDGREVPFCEVAAVDEGRGFATIKRVDRCQAVNVTAAVDPAHAMPWSVIADLKNTVLPDLLADYPGVSHTFEGTQAEQRDTIKGLVKGFALAILLIYALLAVPLRSYVQPLIIMLAIPFGLVGAVWGHLIMGIDLTIMSMFGIVALAGVVVNDSLVMVDFINRHRQAGGELLDAVRQSGAVRFRAILLTSLTTFAGLFPLIMEKSLQAQFLIPMAISLAFGVVFSTAITLVLVPAGYMILEDCRRVIGRS